MAPDVLKELTIAASAIEPADTPIILPYLQGERAPLWNSKLTASILEMNSSHGTAHLFRALPESIAFARRQCFEQIGIEPLQQVKIGGGSSNNKLWNSIRATVWNKPVAAADEKELAMAGLLYYEMQASGSTYNKPAINFMTTTPERRWIDDYEKKYKKYVHYQ